MESGKPATDAQWAEFQAFAQGATIRLAKDNLRILEDPGKLQRQMEESATQGMTVEVLGDGRRVALSEGLQGVEHGIIKRIQGEVRLAMRRSKVAQLRSEFEGPRNFFSVN